jgi:hypothetical protein
LAGTAALTGAVGALVVAWLPATLVAVTRTVIVAATSAPERT